MVAGDQLWKECCDSDLTWAMVLDEPGQVGREANGIAQAK